MMWLLAAFYGFSVLFAYRSGRRDGRLDAQKRLSLISVLRKP